VLFAGGDGTINEVANGMVHSRVPLGILPAGTANVLATELGLGRGFERAVASISEYAPMRIAAGRMLREIETDSRYFLLMAGIGFDAYIVYNLIVGLKAPLGKAAYWLSALVKLGRKIPQFIVEVDGREFVAAFGIASRVRNYGGDFEIAHGASILSDQFEIVLFEAGNSVELLKYALVLLTHRRFRLRGVAFLHADKARFSPFSTARVHLQLDGEHVGFIPARIEIVPQAISVLVPAEFRDRYLKASVNYCSTGAGAAGQARIT
jgi:diacylglycerol kinase (ATP)